MSIRALVTLLALLVCGGYARAVEVQVNGVQVTGSLRDVTLEKVNVRFDEKGNVVIDAPMYAVSPDLPAPMPATEAPQVDGRYYVVATAAHLGHYDVDVKVNDRSVTRVLAGSPTWLTEITGSLAVGANSVVLTFLPKPDPPMMPESPAIELMVVRGDLASDGTLTVTRVFGKSTRKTGQRMAEAVTLPFEVIGK